MKTRSKPTVRKVMVASVSIAALGLSACGGGSFGTAEESAGTDDQVDVVKIGLAVPKSGVYAAQGKDLEQGFKLFLEQNDNQLGGKEVELIEVDEGSDPQAGVPATTKLITSDQVSAVVGIANSATAAGLRETFIENRVPLIVGNAGADALTEPPSEFIWRTSFTNGGVDAPLGPQVAQDLGEGSVYLLAADYAAGAEHINGFKTAFLEAGGTIAGEQYTPFGQTTDWQPYLNEIRGSGAEAVFVFYAGAEAVNFVKQYDQFLGNEDIQLYGSGFLTEGIGVLESQGEAAEGVKTVLHYSDRIDSPTNSEFVKAYIAMYGDSPTVYAVQMYDAGIALDKAIAAADGTSGEEISEALGSIGEIESPRGTWKFDASHNPEQTTYFLREVQQVDGEWVNAVVGELDAG